MHLCFHMWLLNLIVYPCGSLPQFEDSEDDFDRFDTDDESSYRRDSVYSCVTLPYFHSFLYIKGKYCHSSLNTCFFIMFVWFQSLLEDIMKLILLSLLSKDFCS